MAAKKRKHDNDSSIYRRFIETKNGSDLVLLHEEYGESLILYALSIVHDRLEAEDIVYDFFEKLLNNRPEFENFRSYAFSSIGRNSRRSIQKKQRRSEILKEQIVPPSIDQGHESSYIAKDLSETITSIATDSFSEEARKDAVLMRVIHGNNYKEIEEDTGVKPSRARKDVFDFKKLLSKKLSWLNGK